MHEINKMIYWFSTKTADGDASMRDLLGGKGANLAEMCKIGMPVPPGFTLSSDVCTYYYKNKKNYPKTLKTELTAALSKLEDATGKRFADVKKPLLLSIRSGARSSMPGMMDTILNLGLNDQTVIGLAESTNDARFAFDSYRRFIQMYSSVVLNLSHDSFEQALEDIKFKSNVKEDMQLSIESLKILIDDYKYIVRSQTGEDFIQNPHEQIWNAISAVFNSWMSPRAIVYRNLNNISENWGTAVNVQAMVFGNMGNDCATGVAFTRNPSTGENTFFGEYLINAQGEDVVAGIRTPQHLSIQAKIEHKSEQPSMEETMPTIYRQLCDVRTLLEKHYRDVQDIEFTVESGTLYLLQTRSAKRTTAAALKIACDMVDEGFITKKDALMRIDPKAFEQVLHPILDPSAKHHVLTRGLPASPGAASGQIAFSADIAESMAIKHNMDVLLLRNETSPEDIHGMNAAKGILTARGGMTSHAAVVARSMGRPCITSATNLIIDEQAKSAYIGDIKLSEGDWLTINGSSGEVMVGLIDTIQPKLGKDFKKIMRWSDEFRTIKVRTNSDTPEDTQIAFKFGAEGIGLCRTEHMFFESDRINAFRQMIVANDLTERRKALKQILPMQQSDFEKIFFLVKESPVTIRLLDPPLHEFLPRENSDFDEIAKVTGKNITDIRIRAKQLQESNPMLGHRGCRLLNSYPEICEMQAQAIFSAAKSVYDKTNISPTIEIMIPLVSISKELTLLKNIIAKVAADMSSSINYSVGTMIELPRAALLANEIALDAEFFSFGTNDLTQTTYGLSRDDSARFLMDYERLQILAQDPFTRLDEKGVGELIKIAIQRGRSVRPDIKLGICGEHSGDPDSINFCVQNRLDYVSCSPYRVPIARLAAAQAAIKNNL